MLMRSRARERKKDFYFSFMQDDQKPSVFAIVFIHALYLQDSIILI